MSYLWLYCSQGICCTFYKGKCFDRQQWCIKGQFLKSIYQEPKIIIDDAHISLVYDDAYFAWYAYRARDRWWFLKSIALTSLLTGGLQNSRDQVVLTFSSVAMPVSALDLTSQLTHAVLYLGFVTSNFLFKLGETCKKTAYILSIQQ